MNTQRTYIEKASFYPRLQVCCLFNVECFSALSLANLKSNFVLHFLNTKDIRNGEAATQKYHMILCDTTNLSLISSGNKLQLFGNLEMPLFLLIREVETVQVKLLTHPLVNRTLIMGNDENDVAQRLIRSYQKGLLNEVDQSIPNDQQMVHKIPGFLDRLHNVIRAKAESSNLSLEEIADCLALSQTVLRKKIKKMTGLTAVQYILQYRLCMAKDLLQYQDLNVQETAMQTGFMSLSYFTKSFKARFGKLPSYYLAQRPFDVA